MGINSGWMRDWPRWQQERNSHHPTFSLPTPPFLLSTCPHLSTPLLFPALCLSRHQTCRPSLLANAGWYLLFLTEEKRGPLCPYEVGVARGDGASNKLPGGGPPNTAAPRTRGKEGARSPSSSSLCSCHPRLLHLHSLLLLLPFWAQSSSQSAPGQTCGTYDDPAGASQILALSLLRSTLPCWRQRLLPVYPGSPLTEKGREKC